MTRSAALALAQVMTDVATLVARYREEEAKMREEFGDDAGFLDPTRVWSGEEFMAVLEAAERWAERDAGLAIV